MQLLTQTGRSRTARTLALAALLLVTGLWNAEPAHQHPADDVFFECLLCHGGMDAHAAPLPTAENAQAPAHTLLVAEPGALPRAHSVTPPARGPPDFS